MIISTIPLDFNVGRHDNIEVSIPDSGSILSVKIKRRTTLRETFWVNDTVKIKCQIFLSYDNGVTFEYFGTFGASGGIRLKRDGSEADSSSFTTRIKDGVNRKVKLSIQVIGGKLISEIEIEIL